MVRYPNGKQIKNLQIWRSHLHAMIAMKQAGAEFRKDTLVIIIPSSSHSFNWRFHTTTYRGEKKIWTSKIWWDMKFWKGLQWLLRSNLNVPCKTNLRFHVKKKKVVLKMVLKEIGALMSVEVTTCCGSVQMGGNDMWYVRAGGAVTFPATDRHVQLLEVAHKWQQVLGKVVAVLRQEPWTSSQWTSSDRENFPLQPTQWTEGCTVILLNISAKYNSYIWTYQGLWNTYFWRTSLQSRPTAPPSCSSSLHSCTILGGSHFQLLAVEFC